MKAVFFEVGSAASMSVWHGLKSRIEASQTGRIFAERSPEYLRTKAWLFAFVHRYFRADIRGGDRIPMSGPALLVGNHSGGLYTPEVYVTLGWWLQRQGYKRPLWILAHDLLLGMPYFGKRARKAGCVHANDDNARAVLERNDALLVYPGGEHEAFRPVWLRNQVDFKQRKGFIRLALETGAPVVPVVTHGSHHTTVVVWRGQELARLIKLPMLRTRVLPLVFALPWGLAPGFIPSIPFPARITIEFLDPIRWDPVPLHAQTDELLQACYDEMMARMQEALTRLARERPFPLISR